MKKFSGRPRLASPQLGAPLPDLWRHWLSASARVRLAPNLDLARASTALTCTQAPPPEEGVWPREGASRHFGEVEAAGRGLGWRWAAAVSS